MLGYCATHDSEIMNKYNVQPDIFSCMFFFLLQLSQAQTRRPIRNFKKLQKLLTWTTVMLKHLLITNDVGKTCSTDERTVGFQLGPLNHQSIQTEIYSFNWLKWVWQTMNLIHGSSSSVPHRNVFMQTITASSQVAFTFNWASHVSQVRPQN